MSIVAFVPIRSGSKSIKDKNVKLFYGKPLIFWVLEAIQNSLKINKAVVAIDSIEYEKIISKFNFSKVEIYHRLPENAVDTASTESVMLEYLNFAGIDESDIFILVQATSPFTTSTDFDLAIEKFLASGKDSMLSCVRTKRFFWDRDGIPVNYDFYNRPRRQDFDGLFMENGAFYINSVSNVLNYKNRLSGNVEIYEMPEFTSLELDEPLDWKVGEMFMKLRPVVEMKIFSEIKLFMTDVDGVLTDAGMYYSEKGDEAKKFNTYDGMGLKLLQEKGIRTGIITSENRNLNRKRAEKLKLDFDFHDQTDKLKTIKDLCGKLNIQLKNVAYIGDDINDFELLSNVGIAACPSNAREKIRSIPGIIHLKTEGGKGAVREFAELILEDF